MTAARTASPPPLRGVGRSGTQSSPLWPDAVGRGGTQSIAGTPIEASPVCGSCNADLLPLNTNGTCAECRHIERDRHRGFTAEEVALDDARTNFMAVFAGLYRPLDTDAVYMRGACRTCARYVARHDTGKCEWCSGPRRFPAKRKKRP